MAAIGRSSNIEKLVFRVRLSPAIFLKLCKRAVGTPHRLLADEVEQVQVGGDPLALDTDHAAPQPQRPRIQGPEFLAAAFLAARRDVPDADLHWPLRGHRR